MKHGFSRIKRDNGAKGYLPGNRRIEFSKNVAVTVVAGRQLPDGKPVLYGFAHKVVSRHNIKCFATDAVATDCDSIRLFMQSPYCIIHLSSNNVSDKMEEFGRFLLASWAGTAGFPRGGPKTDDYWF